MQLRNELTSSFGVELPPTVTFDYPTPTGLAGFIAGQMGAPLPAAPALADEEAEGAEEAVGAEAAPRLPAVPAVPAGPSMQDMVAEVASIVATVIGADVAADEPLMAAGLDSLGAVQLRNAITERFGVELPPTAALDFPTVLALAGFVARAWPPPPARWQRRWAAWSWIARLGVSSQVRGSCRGAAVCVRGRAVLCGWGWIQAGSSPYRNL